MSYSEDDMKASAAAAFEQSDSPKERLRYHCMSRGYNGILSLGKLFRRQDKDRSHSLSIDEVTTAINQMGLELSDAEIAELFQDFDSDGQGMIDYEEFLAGLRPEMSSDRVAVVDAAFDSLDSSGDGFVTLEDLKSKFNVSEHPNVVSGLETEDEVLGKFISQIDGMTTSDGMIRRGEFIDYYSGISNSIDNDDYFIEMVKKGYGLD